MVDTVTGSREQLCFQGALVNVNGTQLVGGRGSLGTRRFATLCKRGKGNGCRTMTDLSNIYVTD